MESRACKSFTASIGGTVAAMHCVMLGLRSAAANIAGGTHHAFPGHGEGFCVFNDIAVAARVALDAYSGSCTLKRPILVIDLDVHQGNGTAKIFEKDNRVITFSIHGANNYPWRTKMKSDYDVDLPDDTDDKVYLAVLSDWLQRLFSSHNPSLIFFQAGVDALREDSFGRLAMTRQGLLQRNNMVYTACLTRELPLVITMGGGVFKAFRSIRACTCRCVQGGSVEIWCYQQNFLRHRSCFTVTTCPSALFLHTKAKRSLASPTSFHQVRMLFNMLHVTYRYLKSTQSGSLKLIQGMNSDSSAFISVCHLCTELPS